METSKLKKWANLLLDTGKRNNLINFKDSGNLSAEIIAPDLFTLFRRAERSAAFEVFDPKTEDDLSDGPSISSAGDRESILAAYGEKLKKNQILLFNSYGKPIRAVKRIGKQARSAVEETGVNIAYLAFGFISWTEDRNSQIRMRAPLLLIPVTVENNSAVEPYFIRAAEEEIIVNPTFSYKLQSEYGFSLPEYDEDEGIEAYFEKAASLLSALKWTVEAACKIAVFSFQKINMYRDLVENEAKILQNPNILSLLGEGSPASATLDRSADLMELHNVVDADSSQAEAVEAAKEGGSFVLQGPPGTGKSQTITNIIAECLYDGKKVLFVSEKLAALNVVYDKLKKVGLEEFCLELHSHKANKKQIIEELCKTMRLPKSGVSERAERELRAKKESMRQLDAYAAELHKIRPAIGRTLYQIYEEIAALRGAPDIDFVIDGIEQKGEDFIERAESDLNRYTGYLPSVGRDYHANVWYGYAGTDASFRTAMQLKEDLRAAVLLTRELGALGREVQESLGISTSTLGEAKALGRFFALAAESGFLAPKLFSQAALHAALGGVGPLRTSAAAILEDRAKLNGEFDEDIYTFDGKGLQKKLKTQYKRWFSRLFSGEYRRIANALKLCRKNGKKPKYAEAVAAVGTLARYQGEIEEFRAAESPLSSVAGSAYCGADTDFGALEGELRALGGMLDACGGISALSSLSAEEYEVRREEFGKFAAKYSALFSANAKPLEDLLSVFDSKEYDIEGVPFEALAEKFSRCAENIDSLDNWCNFYRFLKQTEETGLRAYLDHAIGRRISADMIAPVYRRAFYVQWADEILRNAPILTELKRVPHDELIERFKEKDRLNFEINRAVIKAKLSAARPDLGMVAQGSAISVLLRENEKKRKKKGIRQLLRELGDLPQTLKPCFLMSPLSVSTYLDPDMKFDVVIFDEASQIFPQDAVGAIYRGAQLIVVGDSRQMPPSNFFTAATASEDDDEEEDVTDFESILDLCSSAFPQRRLKWHYRSRYEQLISFSNKNFYDNDLVTFPSAQADGRGIGVDFLYVDGVFDRKSKTNLAEAEKISDLVFENFKKYPKRSLGVVAFSMAQQNLIDKLIEKRRREDPVFEEFFKADRAEPFFVKNLETVQGDERDTIIFSIAYAKDAQGRFLLNFGPLNREGGERRLNVAVTRAKVNVWVVASIHAYDIDLSRTNSEGARLLREYLDYAENGEIAFERSVKVNPYEQYDSEFEMEVCEFLRGKGYSVDTQVGCSSFRIDLALKRPNSSDYLLAIECDGATYHSSGTARDRDRLRQDILERMGWKFYRIWSTDWFMNRKVEEQRLLEAVGRALENAPRAAELPAFDFERTLAETHFEFPKYIPLNVLITAHTYRNDVFSVVCAIVQAEAPISEEWLLKRIVFLFGREKVTNVVREAYERAMWNCERRGIVRKDGFLYQRGKEIPMLRVPAEGAEPREIKYIDLTELSNGLREILRQNVTAEKQGLFKLITQLLGFSRMGDAINDRLESALFLLADETDTDGGMISLKSHS